MTQLRSALEDLASDVPPPQPAPDLWRRGVRRRRRVRAAGVLAAVLVVLAGAGGVRWVSSAPSVPEPADAPASRVGIPDHLYAASPWTAGTDDAGPPGRIAVLYYDNAQRGSWSGAGSRQGWVAVSAEDGSYRYLDELGELGPDAVSLSPNGRYVAFPMFGSDDPHGNGAAVGFQVYDAVTGQVRRVPLATRYGLGTTWLTFPWAADSSAVYAEVWRDTSADGSSAEYEDTLAITPTSGDARSLPDAGTGVEVFGDQLVEQKGRWLRTLGGGEAGNLLRVPRNLDQLVRSPTGLEVAAIRDTTPATSGDAPDGEVVVGAAPPHGTLRVRSLGDLDAVDVVGWATEQSVVVTRAVPGEGMSVAAVDTRTGEVTPFVTVAPGYKGFVPQVAGDLLTSPTVPGGAPPSPWNPRLKAGLVGVLGLGAVAAGVVLWRRRTRGLP